MNRFSAFSDLLRRRMCFAMLQHVVLAAATGCGLSSAFAAQPQLQRLEPQGAQRGGEATIALHGARLGKDPQEILLYREGIAVQEIDSVDENQVKVTLSLAEDCPLGIHGLRVRTATGLSNLMTFHVGALPEMQEEEPNNLFDEPQTIPLDVVVNGVIKREDVDYFAVDAKAGERVSLEIEGLRLGRTFFDPAITVLDERRFEVARRDDATLLRQDAYCSFLATHSGKYIVEVRETAYRGDDASSYRLHVGRFPRPSAVFPPGGAPGEELKVRWIGDPTGDREETIALPDAADAAHEVFATDGQGVAPSGVPMRVLDLPNVLEVEPNNGRGKATQFTAPAACAGVINEPGDRDFFRFTAKKDETLDLRVVAREIRSPLDPVLRVTDIDGKRLAGNDDDAGRPDSYLRFKAPADGDYLLQVEDHLRTGGADYVYRIEATRPTPIVDLQIEEQRRYESQTIEIPRGNRMAIMVRATRRDVGGPLTIEIPQLPEGVTATPIPLAGNYNRVPIVFEASADAPLGATLSPVRAKRQEPDRPLTSRFKQQTWLVRGRNNRPVWNHWAQRAAIAVTEGVPFKLRLIEPKSPLVRNGSKELHLVAERDEGFEGAISLRPFYNPPGVSSNNSRRIKKGETEAVVPITANKDARTREWDIAVRGQTNYDGRVVISTQFVKLRVAEPYLAMQFPTASVEQGGQLNYEIGIEQRTPFEGTARVELLGLPPGVTTEPQKIDASSEQVVFPLKIAADARTGVHKQLFCRVVITENDEPVLHNIYRGELRIDKRPPTEQAVNSAADAGGKS